MPFVVKVAGETIGVSELEAADAAMGCASGRFIPTPAYRAFQHYCIERRENNPEISGLTVETAEGVEIECNGGIQIFDFSPELGEKGLQIHLLGVTKPPYEQLFPHHVKAYEEHWNTFSKKSWWKRLFRNWR